MDYRIVIFCLSCIFMNSPQVYADNSFMIDEEIEQEPALAPAQKEIFNKAEVETIVPPKLNQDMQVIHEFIQQEDARLREIKLLDLEFQKTELLTKIAKLNHDTEGVKTSQEPVKRPVQDIDFHLRGIMKIGAQRIAMATVDDKSVSIHEGDVISNGNVVKRIDEDKVVILTKAGSEKIYLIGG